MLSVATAEHDRNRVTHLCKRVTVILVCTERSKRRGRKRNSQEDAVPRSKINTETEAEPSREIQQRGDSQARGGKWTDSNQLGVL